MSNKKINKVLKIVLIVSIMLLAGVHLLAKSGHQIVDIPDMKSHAFVDITQKAGLDRINDSYSHCWGDINGDGLPDIFIINHISYPLLYRNNGDDTFEDITSYSGIKRMGDHHGCAIADYDNDGDQDIYVTVGAQRGRGGSFNRLYRNNGKGEFMDVALEAAVTDSKGRGRSASWVDYNNDGFLDLFIANDKRNDAPSGLFKNNGNGTFSDTSGLSIVNHLTEANWIDYDNDGFMDLTVAIYGKHLKGEIIVYKNIGDGTFKKTRAFNGRSYAWGDYDNDGDMDILVTNPPRVHILKYEIEILSKFFKGFVTLYENTGGDGFIDVSNKSGFKRKMGGEKAIFFDYDNDGDLDIYLLVSGSKSRNIKDMVFRNNNDKTYSDVTKAIGLNQSFRGTGCGVAFADFNNDGFLDLFLTNGKAREPYEMYKYAGPYVLFKNRGNNNHWLKIKLIGTKSNRDGIGAKVKLYIGDQIQYRQNNGGMEGYIQNNSMIHFGIGNADDVDNIEIVWPSGFITNISDIKANQTLIIYEES
jgi:hypothetical protein